jgi:hypothetical protein
MDRILLAIIASFVLLLFGAAGLYVFKGAELHQAVGIVGRR